MLNKQIFNTSSDNFKYDVNEDDAKWPWPTHFMPSAGLFNAIRRLSTMCSGAFLNEKNRKIININLNCGDKLKKNLRKLTLELNRSIVALAFANASTIRWIPNPPCRDWERRLDTKSIRRMHTRRPTCHGSGMVVEVSKIRKKRRRRWNSNV